MTVKLLPTEKASFALQSLKGKRPWSPLGIGPIFFGRFPALHRLVVNRSPVYFTTAGDPQLSDPVIDEEWLQRC